MKQKPNKNLLFWFHCTWPGASVTFKMKLKKKNWTPMISELLRFFSSIFIIYIYILYNLSFYVIAYSFTLKPQSLMMHFIRTLFSHVTLIPPNLISLGISIFLAPKIYSYSPQFAYMLFVHVWVKNTIDDYQLHWNHCYIYIRVGGPYFWTFDYLIQHPTLFSTIRKLFVWNLITVTHALPVPYEGWNLAVFYGKIVIYVLLFLSSFTIIFFLDNNNVYKFDFMHFYIIFFKI